MVEEIRFKEEVKKEEIEMLTLSMWALLQIFHLEASLAGEQTLITSIMDEAQGRISHAHEQGRAVDIRTRDWRMGHEGVKEFCAKFNQKYKKLGAVGLKSGIQTPCVYHQVEGSEWHIHLQSIN